MSPIPCCSHMFMAAGLTNIVGLMKLKTDHNCRTVAFSGHLSVVITNVLEITVHKNYGAHPPLLNTYC